MSGKILLVPDVFMSRLAEINLTGTDSYYKNPCYIPVPKKLIEVFGEGNTILLYPYEWTEQEAKDWLQKDVDAWKAENKDTLGELFP